MTGIRDYAPEFLPTRAGPPVCAGCDEQGALDQHGRPVCTSGLCEHSELGCLLCGELECDCELTAREHFYAAAWMLAEVAGVRPGAAIQDWKRRNGLGRYGYMRAGDYLAVAIELIEGEVEGRQP